MADLQENILTLIIKKKKKNIQQFIIKTNMYVYFNFLIGMSEYHYFTLLYITYITWLKSIVHDTRDHSFISYYDSSYFNTNKTTFNFF